MSEPGQTSQSSPYKIFISYRREDSQDTVGHIYSSAQGAPLAPMPSSWMLIRYRLAMISPATSTFVLRQCRVVLIVMGPTWPTVVAQDGPYKGQPRLDNPDDHVRIETEQALALSPVNDGGRADWRSAADSIAGAGRQHAPPGSVARQPPAV